MDTLSERAWEWKREPWKFNAEEQFANLERVLAEHEGRGVGFNAWFSGVGQGGPAVVFEGGLHVFEKYVSGEALVHIPNQYVTWVTPLVARQEQEFADRLTQYLASGAKPIVHPYANMDAEDAILHVYADFLCRLSTP
jgi:hypothetical protein